MDPNLLLRLRIHAAMIEVTGEPTEPDADGDWSIRTDDRLVFIRPATDPSPHALVIAGIARATSTDCLTEVNALNTAAAWTKFVRSPAGDIFAVHRLPIELITASSLSHAISSIATCVKDCATTFQAVYGEAADSAQSQR